MQGLLHALRLLLYIAGLCERLWARLRRSRVPGGGQAANGQRPRPPEVGAVIVAEAGPWAEGQLAKVAWVLAWLHAAGLRQVQAYDPAGRLKAERAALQALLAPLCSASVQVWDPGPTGQPSRAGAAGLGEAADLQVVLLSPADTPGLLAARAGLGAPQGHPQSADPKGLPMGLPAEASQVVAPRGSPPTQAASLAADGSVHITLLPKAEQLLPEQLSCPSGLPDPSLVLVFGPDFTTAGFPPWGLHFSEFLHLGRLEGVDAAAMHGAMRRFLHTSQRFGK